jgi:tRNA-modifying protein YgfZ
VVNSNEIKVLVRSDGHQTRGKVVRAWNRTRMELGLRSMTSHSYPWASQGGLCVVEPTMGTLRVVGDDRLKWLNGLVTSNLTLLKPGGAQYCLLITKVGRIVSDLWVLALEDSLLLAVPAGKIEVLQEHFDRYLVMEDAEIIDETGKISWLHWHGSQARTHARTVVAELADCWAGRLDFTPLGGAVVAFAVEQQAAVREQAQRLGAVWSSIEDWNVVRIELGIPQFGIDFDEKTYPQEASLKERAVSFDKGCYLGQEVVCMLEMRGKLARKLITLSWPVGAEGVLPEAGEIVTDKEGKNIGSITSAARSPDLGKGVAFAMLKTAFASPGTTVNVAGLDAEVTSTPLRAELPLLFHHKALEVPAGSWQKSAPLMVSSA